MNDVKYPQSSVTLIYTVCKLIMLKYFEFMFISPRYRNIPQKSFYFDSLTEILKKIGRRSRLLCKITSALHYTLDTFLIYEYLFRDRVLLIVNMCLRIPHPFGPTFNRLLLISQTEIIQIGHLLPLNLLQVL
jgi:hypothetical protein